MSHPSSAHSTLGSALVLEAKQLSASNASSAASGSSVRAIALARGAQAGAISADADQLPRWCVVPTMSCRSLKRSRSRSRKHGGRAAARNGQALRSAIGQEGLVGITCKEARRRAGCCETTMRRGPAHREHPVNTCTCAVNKCSVRPWQENTTTQLAAHRRQCSRISSTALVP